MHSRLNRVGRVWLALLLVVVGLTTLPVQAQSFFGSIVGAVTDSTGAVVPGATVSATNTGTNEKRTSVSDAAGSYRFVNLVPATYKVEFEKANFKRYVLPRVLVEVGGTDRADAVLQVGAASETVEVTTNPPLMETESSSLSQQVTGKTVQEMPLNGRNTMNLIALATGVVPQGSSQGSTGLNSSGGNTSAGGWGNYQIGGNIAGQGASYVDGAPINTLGGNTMGLVPTQDSVQEFAVSSSNVGAEFGRYGGGVVNMTTKSGSNAFHGSAYEYFRNTVLDSNDFFNKSFQLQVGMKNKPLQFNQNQYGVVFSGPAVKNKVFFLYSWEGYKSRIGLSSPAIVPTENLKNGIIAETYAINGKTGLMALSNSGLDKGDPLKNCTITHPVKGTATSPGYYTITNLSSCISPFANVVKQYYGPPTVINGAQYSDAAGDNYFRQVAVGDNQNQYTGRIDYNISPKQRFFGRYTYWNITDTNFNQFPMSPYNVGGAAMYFRTHQVVLGDTYTVNQKTVVDLRLSFMRGQNLSLLPNMNVDETIFGGTWGQLGSFMPYKMYPLASLSAARGGQTGGAYGFYNSFGNGYYAGFNDTYSISGSLIRIMGRHNLKIGGEARKMDNPSLIKTNSGQYTFDGTYTTDAWADLLMGYSSQGNINVGTWTTAMNYYQAYYVQDSWQLSRKLTVNLGLRYELPGGMVEINDKNTVLLPDSVDPNTKVTGTIGLVNDPQGYGSRSSIGIRHKEFAPNLGFAYRLNSKTSIRGGYGLSYLPPDMGSAAPSASPINSNAPAYTNGASAAVYYPVTDPIKNFGALLAKPQGRNNFSTYIQNYVPTVTATNGVSQAGLSAGNPKDPTGYMQQWNLSLSRELKGDSMIEVAYAGTRGTHLAALSGEMNQLDPKYASQYSGNCLMSASTVSTDPSYCKAKVTVTTPGGVSQLVTFAQSLRPYQFYTGFSDTNAHWGSTSYNALQVKFQKRFKSGGLIMTSYTWSKLLGDTDTATPGLEVKSTATSRDKGRGILQNNYDHRAERSILSYQVPQRIVVSYVMPLPFGQGQRWAHFNGVAGRLVSGWAANGISSFQTGFPLALMESTKNNWTSFGAGTIRPNYTAGCNKIYTGSAYSRLGSWFNTSCFTSPSTSTGLDANNNFSGFGNEPRVDGTLRSAGIANWDLSVLKSTKITERISFQFRSEFFNIFNRVQFAPPGVSNTGTGFGQIKDQANQPRLIQFSGRLSF